MMSEVENFIYSYDDKQKEIMLYFHNLLLSYPEITSKISFKIPFYYRKSWICYLNPLKNGNIEFAFPRGSELSNNQGLLNSKGRKQVLSVEFANLKDVATKDINEIIQEAVLLDETTPYNVKKM